MKKKIAGLLTALMLIGSLTGCGEAALSLREGVDLSSEIEIICVLPTNYTEDSVIENSAWNKVALYINKADFRTLVDSALGIIALDELEGFEGKVGILYIDGEGYLNFANSFREVLGNKAFYTGENLAALDTAAPEQKSTVEKIAYLSNYFNIFDADAEEITDNALVSRQAFFEALYRFDNRYSEVVNSDLDVLGALGVTSPTLSQSMASVVAGDAWLRAENGEVSLDLMNMNITKFEALYTVMQQYFPNELAAGITAAQGMVAVADGKAEGFEGDTAFTQAFTDVTSVVDIGTEERVRIVNEEGATEVADGYRTLILSKQLEKTDGSMDYEMYGCLLAANKLGLVQGNINLTPVDMVEEGGNAVEILEAEMAESNWNSAVTQQDVAEMLVNAALVKNMQNGFVSETDVANADYSREMTDEQYTAYVNAVDARIIAPHIPIAPGYVAEPPEERVPGDQSEIPGIVFPAVVAENQKEFDDGILGYIYEGLRMFLDNWGVGVEFYNSLNVITLDTTDAEGTMPGLNDPIFTTIPTRHYHEDDNVTVFAKVGIHAGDGRIVGWKIVGIGDLASVEEAEESGADWHIWLT